MAIPYSSGNLPHSPLGHTTAGIKHIHRDCGCLWWHSDPLGLRSLLYVYPSFLGMLTPAASQNHPCRSWRMCPSDYCSCRDPQVDSAPWGEMLFLKGFTAFVFSVPHLCWGGFWSLLGQRKNEHKVSGRRRIVRKWSLFSHLGWCVWQMWDWWKQLPASSVGVLQ